VDEEKEEVQTKFMRRLPSKYLKVMTFAFPDVDDVCVHSVEDIVMSLPIPVTAGGTARCSKQFKFYGQSLAQYANELE